MFKVNYWVLGLILLALVIAQNKADDEHAEVFNKEMDSMFGDDDDMKETISRYLDVVPVSHSSKKHAQRCFISASFHTKTTTSTTTTNTTHNKPNAHTIKSVLGAIFKIARKNKNRNACPDCSKQPCTFMDIKYKNDCIPCPKEECKKECAPCPFPRYCRPALDKEKCPPKPICDVCGNSSETTTDQNVNSTSTITQKILTKTTTNKKPKPSLKAHKTSPRPDSNETHVSFEEPPPDILNVMKLLMMNEQASSTTTSTTTTETSGNFTFSKNEHNHGSSSTSHKPRSHKSTTHRPSSTSTTTTTTAKASKKEKSGSTTTTTRPHSSSTTKRHCTKQGHCDPSTSTTTTKRSSSTTKRHRHTTKKPQESSSTTKKPETSTSTTRRGQSGTHKSLVELEPAGSLVDQQIQISGNQSMSTVTNTTTTTQNGHTTTNSTTTTTITQGSVLFEKNIKIMVSNETIRNHIIKMIEAIPESTGGEEMKLAEKLLTHFGEHRNILEKVKRKGSNRSFTYLRARTNVKGVLGHILERYQRKHCKCKPCHYRKMCEKCEKPNCPARKHNNSCNGCPLIDIQCPAPKGCPTYPPCHSCPHDDHPDFDGAHPEDLDDVDPKDPVKDGELRKNQECKGFTCDYQKTCGMAPVNPLTPKSKKQGYMNGGEDEIYGEWPNFVSLNISLDTGSGLCGGVLISDRHVLTAAHCVHKPDPNGKPGAKFEASKFKAILGEHDKEKKDAHEEIYNVTEICSSKKFFYDSDHGSTYDFAVLTLEKNVTFNDYVQPACLPYKPLELVGDKKSKCYVVGLGATKMTGAGGVSFAKVVQKMRVKRATCKDWGIKHDDRSRHCFTKSESKGDTCGGDSGGPVICLSKEKRWTVMGLVSYGSEYCDGSESVGWVAVYTRIQALLKTINADCGI